MHGITFTQEAYVELSECEYSRIRIPDGFNYSICSHGRCTVSLNPEGQDDRGVGVSIFSLLHPRIEHAKKVGREIVSVTGKWLVYDYLDEYKQDHFQALLLMNDCALAVNGANLMWSDADITAFLNHIELA